MTISDLAKTRSELSITLIKIVEIFKNFGIVIVQNGNCILITAI